MDKKVIFEPPYDSPIEEQFAWHFAKYVHPDIELCPQYEIPTSHGTFKMDFVIKMGDKLIGVECDGKEYHHIWRDIWRDVAIMENSNVKDVFRFRGSDITYHINECLIILSWYYPDIFDDRGINNLKQLADKDVLEDDFYKERNIAQIQIGYKGFEDEFNAIKSWRINDNYFEYKKIADILKQNPSATIDQLYEANKK